MNKSTSKDFYLKYSKNKYKSKSKYKGIGKFISDISDFYFYKNCLFRYGYINNEFFKPFKLNKSSIVIYMKYKFNLKNRTYTFYSFKKFGETIIVENKLIDIIGGVPGGMVYTNDDNNKIYKVLKSSEILYFNLKNLNNRINKRYYPKLKRMN